MEESTSLHALPDIVGFSGLNAFQQDEFQERLVKCIGASVADAGVRADCLNTQNGGDARLLTFPGAIDISRVLAVMPRRFNDELNAFNRDKAPHARLRVRLAFAMGPSAPGMTGRRGAALITVTRLSNAPALRAAIKARTDAYLGVIIDDYLYRQYVAQQFRPDLDVDEYAPTRVTFPEKNFDEPAWYRLVGLPADAWLSTAPHAVRNGGASERGGGSPASGHAATAHSASGPVDGYRLQNPGHGGPASGGADGGAGEGTRRRKRFPRGAMIGAAGAIIAAMIGGVVSLVIAYFPKNPTPPGPGPTASQSQTPAAASGQRSDPTGSGTPGPSTSASGHVGATYTVYADWRLGVAVYADNKGTTSNAPDIPFNQAVQVACVAPNESGMTSINDFYRIVGPSTWAGTYASCNEFTNGGPRETASDPSIDPRVPHCATS